MGHGDRSRSWCFTINNFCDADVQRLDSLACERICVGRETASTGTPHLQGYVRFAEAQRFSWWKNQFPSAHVEIRKGTEEEATAYCKKEGSVLIDRGVDILEPKRGVKRSRDEIASDVMRSVEGGHKYGAIRRANPLFTFWYRRHIIDYIKDERHLRQDEDHVPDQ